MFERFYRTTASRSMPGSGLGLAIVKQVVTKHGGTITIDTSDRGGACIRIVLPGETGAPGPGLDQRE
ncbi:two-component sensor kinase MprB [Mycobacteroides abscessus subsp. abscessus]|nr:two-component sensor kinase MprB [Mycobacteroides abscessus subsp. abscessus]